MKEPKFKKGEKVFAEELGAGVVQDAYKASNGKGGYLYHIKQDEFMLGNVREADITSFKK